MSPLLEDLRRLEEGNTRSSAHDMLGKGVLTGAWRTIDKDNGWKRQAEASCFLAEPI